MSEQNSEELGTEKYAPFGGIFLGVLLMMAGNAGIGPYAGDTFMILGIMVAVGLWALGAAWIVYQLSDKEENPITIEYVMPEHSSRLLAVCLMVFIKGLLLLPHLIILWLLGFVSSLLGFVGFVTSIFGTYPEFIRNFWWMVSKWNLRVGTWYIGLCDTYPPFDSNAYLYPVEVSFNDREGDSRSSLLTIYGFLGGKAVLMIPQMIILFFYQIVAGFAFFLGPIVVLFDGRYPQSFIRVILKSYLQGIRITAYAGCVTEAYPPLYPEDATEKIS